MGSQMLKTITPTNKSLKNDSSSESELN